MPAYRSEGEVGRNTAIRFTPEVTPMGTIRKVGDVFRAEVRHKTPDGLFYRSETFEKRGQAQVWMGRTESEYQQGLTAGGAHTVVDALRRYARDVSPTHKGERWETVRLASWETYDWAKGRLDRLTSDTLGKWRDARLKVCKGASVRRDLGLLSAVMEEARREWKWISVNPVKDVRKPETSPARQRRVSPSEERVMVKALGYVPGSVPETRVQEVALAFLLSLGTAMRAAEITGLEWERIYLERRFLTLLKTKNGTSRDVPLSAEAIALLKLMGEKKEGKVFKVSAATLDAFWRKARALAAKDVPSVATLHFHDARAECLTRMARKVDVLTLSKISGHLDLKMLSRVYYRETAEDIAARL